MAFEFWSQVVCLFLFSLAVALGFYRWRCESNVRNERITDLERRFASGPRTLEAGFVELVGTVHRGEKRRVPIRLLVEEELNQSAGPSYWETRSAKLRSGAFELVTDDNVRVRVEPQRRVRIMGEAITEKSTSSTRVRAIEVRDKDRVLLEGTLLRRTKAVRTGAAWVLRPPRDLRLTIHLSSAPGVLSQIGVPPIWKIFFLLGVAGFVVLVVEFVVHRLFGSEAAVPMPIVILQGALATTLLTLGIASFSNPHNAIEREGPFFTGGDEVKAPWSPFT